MVKHSALILLGLVGMSTSVMAMPERYYERVMEAVDARNLDVLKQLRSMGVNFNSTNIRGMSPLCETVMQKDYEGYELLLTQGASPYVACMRQLPQEQVADFYANQPPAQTYFTGHFDTARSTSTLANDPTFSGLNLPVLGLGELLLGGVAVGAALTLGHGGSSSSSKYKWTAPLDLDPTTFETNEYQSKEFGSKSINFLGSLHASSAYARGYTGYEIKRNDNGALIGEGEAAITSTKVKVAVVDTGVWTKHPDLENNVGQGYNYVYGVCSDKNSTKCWAYDAKAQKAYLYENWTSQSTAKQAIASRDISTDQWLIYSQRYADYVYKSNDPTPQSAEKWVYFDEGSIYDYDRYYTEEDGKKTWWLRYQKDGKYTLYPVECIKSDDEGNCIAGKIPQLGNLEVAMYTDFDNHGTHVSGLIGATQNNAGMMGVAYNAQIIPVKMDFNIQLLEGLTQAVKSADIVNASFAPTSKERYTKLSDAVNFFDKAIQGSNYSNLLEALRAAAKGNKILVLAAGNYEHGNEDPYDPSWYTYAPLSNMFNGKKAQSDGNIYNLTNLMVTVVSLNSKLNGLASYSAKCGVSKDFCVAAPGGDDDDFIYSTVRVADTGTDKDYNYNGMMGTSQATPIVSGALAVIKGAFPHLTNQQVVQILFETATDLGETGVDEIYGHGLINLAAATDPVGLTKIIFTDSTTETGADAKKSSGVIPSTFANIAKTMPQKLIVLDKYERAFQVPTSSFVRVAKRENKLDSRFKSFVRGDEKVVASGDNFKMAYSERRSDLNSNVIHGSMSFEIRPTTNWSFSSFYTENTDTAGGTYFERAMRAPYAKMKESWGGSVSYNLAKNWKATILGQVGQNGFVDEKDLNDMDHNRVSLLQSSLEYKGLKKVGLKLTAGVSKEQGATLGMWGKGAFKSGNSRTSFVGAGVTLNLTDAISIEGMYYSGVTQVNNNKSLIKMSSLRSDSFAVTAAWKSDKGKTIGLQFVSPLRVNRGIATVDLPVSRDAYQDVVYRDKVQANLKPSAREYDIGLYFSDDLKEDVHFQSEVGVRLNPDHVAGAAPDWRALLGLSFGL